MAGRFTVDAVFRAIDRVTAPVTKMGNRINRTTRKIRSGLTKLNAKLKAVGKTAKSAFGVAGIAGAAFLAQRAVGAVIGETAKFGRQIGRAAALFGGIERGTEAFRALEQAALDVGDKTEFTAIQTADALAFMAKAGLSADASMSRLAVATDFATATGVELARSTDILTDAQQLLGLRSNDTTTDLANFTKVSEQMTKAMTSANLNLEQLWEGMRFGGQVLTVAKRPMAETVALFAALAARGKKGSEAGTDLRRIVSAFTDKKNIKRFREMGIAIEDAQGDLRPMPDLFDDLGKAMNRFGSVKVLALLQEIAGIRSKASLAQFITGMGEEVRELQKVIEDSAGFTKAVAEFIRQDLQGDIDRASSAMGRLAIAFGKANKNEISDTLTLIKEVARSTALFVEANPEVARMAALFLTLGVAALVVGLVFAGIGAAVAFIVGSTTALVVLIGLAAIGFANWLSSLTPVRAWFDDFISSGIVETMAGLDGVTLAVAGGAAGAFGGRGGSVVSPDERLAQTIEERRQTSTATLTIDGATNGTTLTQTNKIPGISISLAESGAPG